MEKTARNALRRIGDAFGDAYDWAGDKIRDNVNGVKDYVDDQKAQLDALRDVAIHTNSYNSGSNMSRDPEENKPRDEYPLRDTDTDRSGNVFARDLMGHRIHHVTGEELGKYLEDSPLVTRPSKITRAPVALVDRVGNISHAKPSDVHYSGAEKVLDKANLLYDPDGYITPAYGRRNMYRAFMPGREEEADRIEAESREKANRNRYNTIRKLIETGEKYESPFESMAFPFGSFKFTNNENKEEKIKEHLEALGEYDPSVVYTIPDIPGRNEDAFVPVNRLLNKTLGWNTRIPIYVGDSAWPHVPADSAAYNSNYMVASNGGMTGPYETFIHEGGHLPTLVSINMQNPDAPAFLEDENGDRPQLVTYNKQRLKSYPKYPGGPFYYTMVPSEGSNAMLATKAEMAARLGKDVTDMPMDEFLANLPKPGDPKSSKERFNRDTLRMEKQPYRYTNGLYDSMYLGAKDLAATYWDLVEQDKKEHTPESRRRLEQFIKQLEYLKDHSSNKPAGSFGNYA